jgi:hypothetical protein
MCGITPKGRNASMDENNLIQEEMTHETKIDLPTPKIQ